MKKTFKRNSDTVNIVIFGNNISQYIDNNSSWGLIYMITKNDIMPIRDGDKINQYSRISIC